MSDFWNTLATNFAGFDGITYAIMAIIVVAAAFMMPTLMGIVSATCSGLFVFGLAVFLRAVLTAEDARSVARDDLAYGMTMPLRTVLIYGAVFCFSIALVYSVRMVSRQQQP